jgi:hypothetical protein
VFIRSKVVKGHTYYQIVQGVRTGPRVRQRIVLALGQDPDPAVALRTMKRTLKRLQKRREWLRRYNQLPGGGLTITEARELKRLDARIGGLESRIETLAGLIETGKVGTTKSKAGTTKGKTLAQQ